jgi:LuxR family maltose regulon positive regulatory protein
VRRTGLVNRLRASPAPVVAVVAPAGYGKTTLLTQWLERDGRPAAWLNAADEDRDEAVLRSSLAAALRSLPSGSGDDPLILVVDDVHVLRGAASGRVLSELGDRLPAGSTLALAGRREPCIPIARLRARGHVFELGVPELALTCHEGRALLEAAGASVSEESAAELVRVTEGWAAGLHLAASVPHIRGADRDVVDYLRLEVLSELTTDVLGFVRRASALDAMCGALCDSVLDRSGSARLLEELERAQLVLVPLDRSRDWYRFHTLFREALRSELDREEPGLADALGGRAAAWLEAHGLPEASVEQARTAGDTDRTVRLVSELGPAALLRGEAETVLRWLDGIGGERASGPAPAVGAWTHALAGSPVEALRWEEASSREPGDAPLPSWHGAGRMRDGAARAAERLPARSAWHPLALALLGVTRLLEGDVEGADTTFADAAQRAELVGAPVAASLALAERALLALDLGAQAIAREHAARASELVERSGLGAYATSSLVDVAGARVALRSRAPSRARDALARVGARAGTRPEPLPWLSGQVLLELARVHIALADAGEAAAALARAELVLAEANGLGVLDELATELGRQLDALPTATGLTAAELRLLPLLATHLSFREIAERLFVSRNTIKTQAISVYRKLGASSRSEAISRALELGLVDGSDQATSTSLQKPIQ